MSWLSNYLRRRRIDVVHQTRRYLAGEISKHGFEIGEYTYGRPQIRRHRWNGARLIVGRYCSIADDAEFILGVEHRSDWVSTFPFQTAPDAGQIYSKGDISIGSDVWIGAGAVILSDVTIGHGAVIGARAVVTKSVSPYAIVVGNPMRVVRRRFSDETILALLQVRWWDRPHAEVCDLIPLLQSSDVCALIARCGGEVAKSPSECRAGSLPAA